jgi:hypothetical protein
MPSLRGGLPATSSCGARYHKGLSRCRAACRRCQRAGIGGNFHWGCRPGRLQSVHRRWRGRGPARRAASTQSRRSGSRVRLSCAGAPAAACGSSPRGLPPARCRSGPRPAPGRSRVGTQGRRQLPGTLKTRRSLQVPERIGRGRYADGEAQHQSPLGAQGRGSGIDEVGQAPMVSRGGGKLGLTSPAPCGQLGLRDELLRHAGYAAGRQQGGQQGGQRGRPGWPAWAGSGMAAARNATRVPAATSRLKCRFSLACPDGN